MSYNLPTSLDDVCVEKMCWAGYHHPLLEGHIFYTMYTFDVEYKPKDIVVRQPGVADLSIVRPKAFGNELLSTGGARLGLLCFIAGTIFFAQVSFHGI